jgi:ribonucleoside-diphosphate reductase alpha chain
MKAIKSLKNKSLTQKSKNSAVSFQVSVAEPKTSKKKLTNGHANGVNLASLLTYTREQAWEEGKNISAVPEDLLEPQMSETSLYIAKTRYAKRNEQGQPIELAKDMFWRVAYNIAAADLQFNSDRKSMISVAKEFYQVMATQKFIPNTPTLLNAGKAMQQLSACFVLPIEDDMRSIAQTLVDMVMIHKSGGGTGFSFSRLRPSGDVIKSSGGTTVGPTSFLQAYNDVTSQVKQGGVRRGANMGIIHITHPDILRFAVMKVDEFSLTNFNISVSVTEDWMEQVKKDKQFVDSEPDWESVVGEIREAQTIRDVDLKLKRVEDGVVKLYDLVRATKEEEGYDLINPRTQEPVDRLNAYKVFLLITQLAWHYGDPGMIIIDRINKSAANPTPQLGMIEATNPCGEQPLLPYDACTLGGINVGKHVRDGEIDWEELKQTIKTGVHFLDNVLDMNNYPIAAVNEMTRKVRRIGLGVMGFADLLVQLGVGYNTEEGLKVAEEVMSFIHQESKKVSADLAKQRGTFLAWEGSIYDPKSPYFRGTELKLRNGAITTIAPTGTTSMLADAASGIEPYFGLSYAKNTIEGKRLFNTNEFFLKVAQEEGFYSEGLLEKIEANHGSVAGLDEVPLKWQKVFVVAHDISPEWHVKVQSAFQKHVDNAISKTINFAHEATVEDVRGAYMLSYELGCKGITIYRDGSREKQILEVKKDNSYYDQLAAGSSHPATVSQPEVLEIKAELGGRPAILRGRTYKINTPVGEAFITVNRDEKDQPFEVFITIGKAGMHTAADAEAVARMISLALRTSRPNSKAVAYKVVSQLQGIGGSSQIGFGKERVMSLADAVAKTLAEELSLLEAVAGEETSGAEIIPLNLTISEEKEPEEQMEKSLPAAGKNADLCPQCGLATFVFGEGCKKCHSCGYSMC